MAKNRPGHPGPLKRRVPLLLVWLLVTGCASNGGSGNNSGVRDSDSAVGDAAYYSDASHSSPTEAGGGESSSTRPEPGANDTSAAESGTSFGCEGAECDAGPVMTGAADRADAGAPDAADSSIGGHQACAIGQLRDGLVCRDPYCCDGSGCSNVLECPGASKCEEGAAGEDARCVGEYCPLDEGYNPVLEACESCGGLTLGCGAFSGETGNVLSVGGAQCVCETEPGYYIGAEGTAQPCDVDGDGWVTISAQPALEGNNAVSRMNARCDVIRVTTIEGQNEDGEVVVLAADLEEQFGGKPEVGIPAGLPLYETDRNDGAKTANKIPQYSGSELDPEAVNSFTRGCISATADLNDNGLADVEEHSSKSLNSGSGEVKERYFDTYTRYSYMLELLVGYAVDAQTYRIAERPRSGPPTGAGMPVVYPDASREYSQSCERGVDELAYDSEVVGPVGVDFQVLSQGLMLHESQYKCVQLMSDAEYTTEGVTAEKAPYQLSLSNDGSTSWSREGVRQSFGIDMNSCRYGGLGEGTADGGSAPADETSNNASTMYRVPLFECSILTEVQAGTVGLAAVGFQEYSEPYVDSTERGDYRRGCFNACIQDDSTEPDNPCKRCEPTPTGKASEANKAAGTECVGETGPSACDGAGTCGTCTPSSARCDGDIRQVCNDVGTFEDVSVCQHGCYNGECYPACNPSTQEQRCFDSETLQSCASTGQWGSTSACSFGCDSTRGRCHPSCRPGTRRCSSSGAPQECSSAGSWENDGTCAATEECVDAGVCEAQCVLPDTFLSKVCYQEPTVLDGFAEEYCGPCGWYKITTIHPGHTLCVEWWCSTGTL